MNISFPYTGAVQKVNVKKKKLQVQVWGKKTIHLNKVWNQARERREIEESRWISSNFTYESLSKLFYSKIYLQVHLTMLETVQYNREYGWFTELAYLIITRTRRQNNTLLVLRLWMTNLYISRESKQMRWNTTSKTDPHGKPRSPGPNLTPSISQNGFCSEMTNGRRREKYERKACEARRKKTGEGEFRSREWLREDEGA